MKTLLVFMALTIAVVISAEGAAPMNATTVKPGNDTEALEPDSAGEKKVRGVETTTLASPGKLILPGNSTESPMETTTAAEKNSKGDAREERRVRYKPFPTGVKGGTKG